MFSLLLAVTLEFNTRAPQSLSQLIPPTQQKTLHVLERGSFSLCNRIKVLHREGTFIPIYYQGKERVKPPSFGNSKPLMSLATRRALA